MKEIEKQLQATLKEAYDIIFGGIDQVKRGCVAVVQCLDKDREATVAYMRKRGVVDEFLELIENVGRGRIHSRLIFMPGAGPERVQRAPLVEQERLINAGVEVVRLIGDEFKKTVKPLAELTRAEAEIAIDSSGNVSEAKQIERIKQRMIHTTFKMPPYSLDGDVLLARENCRIPFAELQRLYEDAEKAHNQKLKSLEADMKKRQVR